MANAIALDRASSLESQDNFLNFKGITDEVQRNLFSLFDRLFGKEKPNKKETTKVKPKIPDGYIDWESVPNQ